MNEIIRAMKERRSIRKFKPDMPPKEMIDQIIEAGLYAASGRNEQAPGNIGFPGRIKRLKERTL